MAKTKKKTITAAVIERRLNEMNLTAADLSKATGLAKSTISQWMSGAIPKPDQAKKVAKFLGVSYHHLFFGEEEQGKDTILEELPLDQVLEGFYHIRISRVVVKDKP